MDDDQIPEEFGGTALIKAPIAMLEARFPESRALLPENRAVLRCYEATEPAPDASAVAAEDAAADEEEGEAADGLPPLPTPSNPPPYTADAVAAAAAPVAGSRMRQPLFVDAEASSRNAAPPASSSGVRPITGPAAPAQNALFSPTMRDASFLRLSEEEKEILAQRVQASANAAARDAAALLRLRGDTAYSSEDDLESGSDWGLSDGDDDDDDASTASGSSRAAGSSAAATPPSGLARTGAFVLLVSVAASLLVTVTTFATSRASAHPLRAPSTIADALHALAVVVAASPVFVALAHYAVPVLVTANVLLLVLFATGKISFGPAARSSRAKIAPRKTTGLKGTGAPRSALDLGVGAAGNSGKAVDGRALKKYLRRLDLM
jgi:hypothetical protein